MNDRTPAEIADQDRRQAAMRNHAEFVRDVYDAFIRQGFDKHQALELTMYSLDHLHGCSDV